MLDDTTKETNMIAMTSFGLLTPAIIDRMYTSFQTQINKYRFVSYLSIYSCCKPSFPPDFLYKSFYFCTGENDFDSLLHTPCYMVAIVTKKHNYSLKLKRNILSLVTTNPLHRKLLTLLLDSYGFIRVHGTKMIQIRTPSMHSDPCALHPSDWSRN